jgi:23S rRNA (uracil1939-C5)-methyltransferase
MATTTEAGSVQTSAALWGMGHFDAQFAGYRFRLSPLTFFQVNEPAAELMVQQVLDVLGAVDGKSVLDVYAGAGTFTLPIASRAKQVLAVENDPTAIDDANHSARANGLDNIHMLPGDAEEELNGLPRHAAEAAVLDPPRAGLAEGVIAELARIDVARIVYVSCDPATLARDLRRFAERGYTVASVQPVDLFPQTFHIESITVLDRR